MPLYEYQCDSCQQRVEVLVRNSSETPQCPECGSKKLKKELSVAAAPAVSGSVGLPTCAPVETSCGRPQCGSGCMFES
ncbi:MAG: zinc ribbon domain-containing protein [Pirellulaceae bacterium]